MAIHLKEEMAVFTIRLKLNLTKILIKVNKEKFFKNQSFT